MQHFFHHSRFLHNPSSFSISTMSSSLTLPTFSPIFVPHRTLSLKNHNFPKSRVFATISTGSQSSTHEASVVDYKVSNAFLFPGQVYFPHCIAKKRWILIEIGTGNDLIWFDLIVGGTSCWNGKRSSECSCCCSFV